MLDAVDVRHLYYFSVVAEEINFRRAADRLFMAQPPLSRQIKQLEERLGVTLFTRHSKGLSLTAEGARVLEIILPLLEMKRATFARLRGEIHPIGKFLRIGFTTAFEQGIFEQVEQTLLHIYGSGLSIARAGSPKLARSVRKGRLDAALVALPLDVPGVMVREIYTEPLIAALPTVWLQNEAPFPKTVSLGDYSGRTLFWFKREAHPAFFDFTKGRFARAGFIPHCIEEPVEHDVLLARIASGEGMGLLAASFSSITRKGVVFAELTEKDFLFLSLGIAVLPDNADVAEKLKNIFMESVSKKYPLK